jgi:hypothetical protein
VLSFNNVCIGASGNKPATIELPHDINVDKVIFTHKSGQVSCHGANSLSNFGCNMQDSQNTPVAIVMTHEVYRDVILPREDMEGIAKTSHEYAWWYSAADVSSRDAKTMTWNVNGKLSLSAARYLLWYNEDLVNVGEEDNEGVACYQVDISAVDSALAGEEVSDRACDLTCAQQAKPGFQAQSWRNLCRNKESCQGCLQCSRDQTSCSSYCSLSPNQWDQKCKWSECKGCAQC